MLHLNSKLFFKLEWCGLVLMGCRGKVEALQTHMSEWYSHTEISAYRQFDRR